MATRPALLAGPPVATGPGDHLRRPAWPPIGRDELGRGFALDSLARAGGPGTARRRQRLLHGVSIHVAADDRATLASQGCELAETAAEQMAGDHLTSRFFLVV